MPGNYPLLSFSIRSLPRIVVATLSCLILNACSGPEATFDAGESCEGDGFIVDDAFAGARRGSCDVFADGHVRINIHPEDPGEINNSPWYAFRVTPAGSDSARVEIRYEGGDHRYWPKYSENGVDWSRIEETAVREHWFGARTTVHVDLGKKPVWISAQEVVSTEDMRLWADAVVAEDQAVLSILGHSGGGEQILRLDINPESDEVVFLAGRQHPPEVTGALGFMAFYETILGDTDLANAFRARFHTLALPMLNPDGVGAGHWRHNLGGVDLNRDWGPFTQPETKLVDELLNEIDANQKKVVVSVDFHSTAKNLIYRQDDESTTRPLDFSKQWINASLSRLPDYIFYDEPRPTSDLPTSRNYMFKRYDGIPAVTYEVADEEERETIRAAAEVFAEEFMRLLLETSPATKSD
jgi:hypothetical protein